MEIAVAPAVAARRPSAGSSHLAAFGLTHHVLAIFTASIKFEGFSLGPKPTWRRYQGELPELEMMFLPLKEGFHVLSTAVCVCVQWRIDGHVYDVPPAEVHISDLQTFLFHSSTADKSVSSSSS